MIDFCYEEDVNSVMHFIDSHWKKDHILASSKEMVDYQYYDKKKERYNIVISKDEKGEIDCILGFIPNSRFSEDFLNEDVVWLSLWKAKENGSNPFIGIMVFSFLKNKYKDSSIATNGMSQVAEEIYRSLGFKVSTLKHYYIANPTLNNFLIAKKPFFSDKKTEILFEIQLFERFDSIIFDKSAQDTSYKSYKYIGNKYSDHPYYKYDFIYIREKNILIVYRVIELFERKVMRIIDFSGDVETLISISSSLEKLIVEEKYEYLDIMVDSVALEEHIESKFICNHLDSETIIPNYFEPLEMSNIEIKFAIYPDLKNNYYVTKGDGDQDRPSLVKGVNI